LVLLVIDNYSPYHSIRYTYGTPCGVQARSQEMEWPEAFRKTIFIN
jgi:hypothetical protein